MITKEFDLKLIVFLKEVDSLGFKLCLVGGAVRDYFFNHNLSKDLDFEVRYSSASKESWPVHFQRLIDFIKYKNLKYEVYPYQIVKIEFDEYSLEFSSPRQEFFQFDKYTHHNFEASLDPNLTFVESFKRRDFTINAIGIELCFSNTDVLENVIDPFNGIKDLNSRVLRNIDDDFYKDSVRFLRLVRFSLKFGFQISDNIKEKIKLFNLSELSNYHFISEMFKTDAASFLNLFSKLLIDYSLDVPNEYNFIKLTLWPTGKIKSKEDLLGWSILFKPEIFSDLQSFFLFPKKTSERIKSFFNSMSFLLKKKEEDFRDLLGLDLDTILSSEILKHLKNIDDKKEYELIFYSQTNNSFSLPFKIYELSLIKITSEEIKMLKAEHRSFYKYYVFLKAKYE